MSKRRARNRDASVETGPMPAVDEAARDAEMLAAMQEAAAPDAPAREDHRPDVAAPSGKASLRRKAKAPPRPAAAPEPSVPKHARKPAQRAKPASARAGASPAAQPSAFSDPPEQPGGSQPEQGALAAGTTDHADAPAREATAATGNEPHGALLKPERDPADEARSRPSAATAPAPPTPDASSPDLRRAIALREAGVATHMLRLHGADEPERLAELLDLIDGPLFRLAPGLYAARPRADADLAAEAAGAVSVEAIPAPPAITPPPGTEPGAEADATAPPAPPAPEIALLGPLVEAAGRTAGPRLVIDAAFALALADQAARGVAEAVTRAAPRPAPSAMTERLDEALATVTAQADRIAAAVAPLHVELARTASALQTPAPPAATEPADAESIELMVRGLRADLKRDRETARTRAEAVSERLRGLSAVVTEIVAALPPSSVATDDAATPAEDGVAALAGQLAELGRRLDGIDAGVADHLRAVAGLEESLGGAIAALPRPNLQVEREGLRRLVVALEMQLRGLDIRLEVLGDRIETGLGALGETFRAEAATSDAAVETTAMLTTALDGVGARIQAQEAAIEDLRAAVTLRPAPDITREREGLHRTTLALQTLLGTLDRRIEAMTIPPPAAAAETSAMLSTALDGVGARMQAQTAVIEDLRAAVTLRPAPDITREREGLHRTTLALQTLLGTLDRRIEAMVIPPPAAAAPSAEALSEQIAAALEGRLARRLEADAVRRDAALDVLRQELLDQGREAVREALAQSVELITARLDAARAEEAPAAAAIRMALAELLARSGFGAAESPP